MSLVYGYRPRSWWSRAEVVARRLVHGWRALAMAVASTVLVSGALGCTTCEDIREDSQALADEFASCVAGDSCKPATVGATDCTGVFICGVAINAAQDEAEFEARARTLQDDYRSSCELCSQAGCVDLSTMEAYCDTGSNRCAFRAK